MKTVVFDFDGVINSYKSGFCGVGKIPDPPVPGVREVIDKLRQSGYTVVVVSTRCADADGLEAICDYLDKYEIEVDRVCAEKPPAVVYVDDRAICFKGSARGLYRRIKKFKSWTPKWAREI